MIRLILLMMPLFAGGTSVGAADPAAGKLLAQRLGCVACHGEDGFGVDDKTPNMGGQDKIYLMRQLRSFAGDPAARERRGFADAERYHQTMEAVTRGLSHEEMDLLASYFSSLQCIPARPPKAVAMPAAARSCAACHGPFGVNIEPGVPDLSGQKAVYLRRQLKAFRASRFGVGLENLDRLRNQSVMAEHGIPLTDEEIDAIATYFAGLGCR